MPDTIGHPNLQRAAYKCVPLDEAAEALSQQGMKVFIDMIPGFTYRYPIDGIKFCDANMDEISSYRKQVGDDLEQLELDFDEASRTLQNLEDSGAPDEALTEARDLADSVKDDLDDLDEFYDKVRDLERKVDRTLATASGDIGPIGSGAEYEAGYVVKFASFNHKDELDGWEDAYDVVTRAITDLGAATHRLGEWVDDQRIEFLHGDKPGPPPR